MAIGMAEMTVWWLVPDGGKGMPTASAPCSARYRDVHSPAACGTARSFVENHSNKTYKIVQQK
jgi:hypothetical protein